MFPVPTPAVQAAGTPVLGFAPAGVATARWDAVEEGVPSAFCAGASYG